MTWGTIGFLLSGQVLGGAGFAILIAALLGDRLRGSHKRRLCAKCRYDMAGVPGLKCPECGRTARSEAGLFTTRRRWWLVVVGLVMMVTGPVVGLGPWWKGGAWFALVPNSLKVELWPYTPDPMGTYSKMYLYTLTAEERARAYEVGLNRLIKSAQGGSPDPGYLGVLNYEDRSRPKSAAARRAIERMLTDASLGCQVHVIGTLYGDHIEPSVQAILRRLAREGDEKVREAVIRQYSSLAFANPWAVDELADLVADDDPQSAFHAAYYFLFTGRKDPVPLLKLYLASAPRERETMRQAAKQLYDDSIAVLYPVLLDEVMFGTLDEATSAAGVLTNAGTAASDLIADALPDADGEAYPRLLRLVVSRGAYSNRLFGALDAIAEDPARSPEHRAAAISTAKLVRAIAEQKARPDAENGAEADEPAATDPPGGG